MTTPVLTAQHTETGQQLKAWCKYCDQWHYHPGDVEGRHVAAHCQDLASPYAETGYTLLLPEVRGEGELETIKLNLGDFYECFQWLRDHPYFFYAHGAGLSPKMARFSGNEPGFDDALTVMVAKVNPVTQHVDRDESKNVETRVWLECGPWVTPDDDADGSRQFTGDPCHDVDLDVGAETFEKAVRQLAEKVMTLHGTYPEYRHCSHCLQRLPAGPTDPEREWFCSSSCAACGPADIVTEPVPGNDSVVRMVPWEDVFDCEHWPRDLSSVSSVAISSGDDSA